jgi:hypothetical protein
MAIDNAILRKITDAKAKGSKYAVFQPKDPSFSSVAQVMDR